MADHIAQARKGDANSDIEQADVALGRKMASRRDHPVVKAAGVVGKIGDQGPLYCISAAVLMIGLGSGKRRVAWSGLSMLGAIAAADLSKRLAKGLIRRTRPNVLLDEGRYEVDSGGSKRKPEQSFPSGHTAGSVAVARALSRNFPKTGAVAGVAAIAIGISRVAKGAHWPLDVLGGAIVGLAAEAGSRALLAVATTATVTAIYGRDKLRPERMTHHKRLMGSNSGSGFKSSQD